MVRASRITPEQQAEERSLRFALVADGLILALLVVVGVVGGSLTITAEAIRGILMALIELFAFLVMRRIHRGVLADLEFGTGKLEQIANLAIGFGMLGGSVWIVSKVFAIIAGERALGTPSASRLRPSPVRSTPASISSPGMPCAARCGRRARCSCRPSCGPGW
jgi:divalent metal cation (Fe/Co/Zn/Cd) transporter